MDGWMAGWMDGWMDVCMYVYVHIYICIYIYVYMYVYLYTNSHVYLPSSDIAMLQDLIWITMKPAFLALPKPPYHPSL